MPGGKPERGACFVVPGDGKEIPGGAEAEARRTAQNLAAAGVPITVLTTCLSGLGSDWDHDHYPPGESWEDGVRVLRFPTAPRDAETFNRLNSRLCAGDYLSWEEELAFFRNMVFSPALFAHIAAHPQMGPFFFIPYLFTTAAWGPLIHPGQSVIVPCLHDEGYARMAMVRRAFHTARAVVFHVPAERELAARLYDLQRTEPLILGEGVDTEWQADPQHFRRKYDLPGPFILYAGRKDAGKNVPLLCTYFLRYLADTEGAGGLKLVMIGNLPAPIPPGGEEHIIDLGFVPLQDKYDAYAAAELLVQPSLMESFSLVIMESWLAGRPVMVHSGCAVTRDHVEASGGGLHFADYPHFAEGLNLLLSRPELCRRMGQAGRRYVLDNYSWPVVTRRYQELIQRLGDEPLPQARPGLDLLRLAGERPRPRPADRSRGRPVRAVHQLLVDFAYGDAIGNDVLAIQKTLRAWGYPSEVFAAHLHPRLRGRARPWEEFARRVSPQDLVIFHFSIGHPLIDQVPGLPGRKVMRYHNITPARFLEGVDPAAVRRAEMGRRQLAELAPTMELGIGVSEYNTRELVEAGCPRTATVPILLDLDHLQRPPDPLVLNRFSGGPPKVLHVGRVVPNKRIEDLIKTQYWLSRLVPGGRLLIVGSGLDTPYGRGLRKLVAELGVEGVYFAGHVGDAELMAYYRAADLYLCLSQHEGFCVPLVESMHFGLPVVAYASSGIPYTLGDAGVLLPRSDHPLVAEVVARVLADQKLRRRLVERGRARLARFHPSRVAAELRAVLSRHFGLEEQA